MSLAKKIAEHILFITFGLFAAATNSIINVAILTDLWCRQRLILTFGLSFCGMLVGLSTSTAGMHRLYIVLTYPDNYDIKNVTVVDCIKRPYIWGFFIANFTPQLLILPIAVFKLVSVTKPLIYSRLVRGPSIRASIVLAIYAFSIILFIQEMIRLSSQTEEITYNVCYFSHFETSDMILIRYVLAFVAIVVAIGMQMYTLILLLRRPPRISSETQ